MTYHKYVRNIPGRKLSRRLGGNLMPSQALVCVLFSMAAIAQVPEPAGRANRVSAPVERKGSDSTVFASMRNDTTALPLLKSGIESAQKEQAPAALRDLGAAEGRLPILADYTAFYSGSALVKAGEFEKALAKLETVWNAPLASPLAPRAILLAAEAMVKMNRAADASALLRQHFNKLPGAEANLMFGNSLEAEGKLAEAASRFQRVFYEFPTSKEADQAESALARVRQGMGAEYPPPTAQMMLGRAQKLMEGGQTAKARRELLAMIPQLGGADRDTARVRLGADDYFARRNQAAYDYLRGLQVNSPEADAERLYYMVASARRLNREGDMMSLTRQLSRQYPDSPWRLEALVTAANSFLVTNRMDSYEPLFQACAENFAGDSRASYCHWKVTWAEYMRRDASASRWLQEHLRKYPASEKASASLYYLGRLAEKSEDGGAARVYYEAARSNFPFSYYAVLSRERLETPAISRARVSVAATNFVNSIEFPKRRIPESYMPTSLTTARLERARLLSTAGLADLSDGELRFAARNDGQGHILAMELARKAQRDGEPDMAIRMIIRYVPDYLYMAMEDAPDSFWRLAFPIPFRTDLERESRKRNLDPFLVAALVRQESLFNPRAVSRAKAYGLAQILPSTGRQIAGRAGVPRFTTSMLYRPDVNLNLGTYYLRMLLDKLDGQWEQVLASYNAGMSRVNLWSTWAAFQEPSEFVETIPFTETRNYVQIVLRNADVYRRLYAGDRRETLAASAASGQEEAARKLESVLTKPPAELGHAAAKKPLPAAKKAPAKKAPARKSTTKR